MILLPWPPECFKVQWSNSPLVHLMDMPSQNIPPHPCLFLHRPFPFLPLKMTSARSFAEVSLPESESSHFNFSYLLNKGSLGKQVSVWGFCLIWGPGGSPRCVRGREGLFQWPHLAQVFLFCSYSLLKSDVCRFLPSAFVLYDYLKTATLHLGTNF